MAVKLQKGLPAYGTLEKESLPIIEGGERIKRNSRII